MCDFSPFRRCLDGQGFRGHCDLHVERGGPVHPCINTSLLSAYVLLNGLERKLCNIVFQLSSLLSTTKIINAESNSGLLNRRRNTKKTKMPGRRKYELREARHKENKEIVLKAYIVTKLPASATKPSRGPCHTLCQVILALIGNGIKCHCCRCQAPPPRTNQRKPNKTARTRMLWQLRVQLVEPVSCHTIYHFISAFVESRGSSTAAPPPTPASLVITIGVFCCVA